MGSIIRTPTPEEVSDSRQEFMNCLQLFFDHARHSLQIQLGLLTAIATVLGVTAAIGDLTPRVLGFALMTFGALLIGMHLVARTSLRVLRAHYHLYIYALIFSAEMHALSGIPFNGWLNRVVSPEISVPLSDLERTQLAEDILEKATQVKSLSTLASYRKLILILSALSIVLGAVFLTAGLMLVAGLDANFGFVAL